MAKKLRVEWRESGSDQHEDLAANTQVKALGEGTLVFYSATVGDSGVRLVIPEKTLISARVITESAT